MVSEGSRSEPRLLSPGTKVHSPVCSGREVLWFCTSSPLYRWRNKLLNFSQLSLCIWSQRVTPGGARMILFSNCKILAMPTAHYYIHINTANSLGSSYVGRWAPKWGWHFPPEKSGFVTAWASSALCPPLPWSDSSLSLFLFPVSSPLPGPSQPHDWGHVSWQTGASFHFTMSLWPWDITPDQLLFTFASESLMPSWGSSGCKSQAELSKCNSEPCQPEDAEPGVIARGSSSARGEELSKEVECESAGAMRSGEEVENEQSLLLSTPKQRGNCLMGF